MTKQLIAEKADDQFSIIHSGYIYLPFYRSLIVVFHNIYLSLIVTLHEKHGSIDLCNLQLVVKKHQHDNFVSY